MTITKVEKDKKQEKKIRRYGNLGVALLLVDHSESHTAVGLN